MDRFILSDDLLTGADDIDAQHRQLFDIANRVFACARQCGNAEREFFDAVSFLSDYVHYHFAAEEHAMAELGYPERELHRQAHADFRQLLGEIVTESLEAPNVGDLSVRLGEMIEGWLTAHIGEADKALARFLRHLTAAGLDMLPSADVLAESGTINERAAHAGRHPSAIGRLRG